MTAWQSVLPLWKDDDGSNFSRDALESWFPADPTKKPERKELWKSLDGNANGFVSLAEFDGWFNNRTLTAEAKLAGRKGEKKSTLFVYARPALIRAFELANGIQKDKKRGAVLDDDDYVTKTEFLLLLLATQLALRIYRIFQLADDSGDRRVTREEWQRHLAHINKELDEYGIDNNSDPLEAADFELIDMDASGFVLLDEAVAFFLSRICTNAKLLAEAQTERPSRSPPPPPSKPVRAVQKQAVASAPKPEPIKSSAQKKRHAASSAATPRQQASAPRPAAPSAAYSAPSPSLRTAPPAALQLPSTPAYHRQQQQRSVAQLPAAPAEEEPQSERLRQEAAEASPLIQSGDSEYPLTLRYGKLEILLKPAKGRAPAEPIDLEFQGVRVSLAPAIASRVDRHRRSLSASYFSEAEDDDDETGFLPAGWTRRWDKRRHRHYYVDHNTKTTTWTHPNARGRSIASSRRSAPRSFA